MSHGIYSAIFSEQLQDACTWRDNVNHLHMSRLYDPWKSTFGILYYRAWSDCSDYSVLIVVKPSKKNIENLLS